MNFWKKIFGKPESSKDKKISPQFKDWVQKSIRLIGTEGSKLENEELLEYLIQKGIPEFEANEIILFLPTAFCRKLLPKLNWPSKYVDYYSKMKQISKKYQDNERYTIMENETNKYWNDKPTNEVVLNIAGRSAEFDAINQMLNDGGELENVRLTESYVIRFEE
jgi:hypothetical protein